MEPLTAEEAEFASEHCSLINFYMHIFALPDEFYGSAAMGYLRAVKRWFSHPELHQWAFSTIAKHCIHTNTYNERRYHARHNPRIVACLDAPIPRTNGLTYADTFQDSHPTPEDLICIRETITECLASRGPHENPKRLGI